MNLSDHLTLDQAVASITAHNRNIDNTPNRIQIENLVFTGYHIYDHLVNKFGRLFISSGFRCTKLNTLVGGAIGSQHVFGQALDIDGDGDGTDKYVRVSNSAIFNYIKDNLEYDQLIAEYESNGEPRWIHVSFNRFKNRKTTLIAVRDRHGKTRYLNYTESLFNKIYTAGRKSVSSHFELPEEFINVDRDELEETMLPEYQGNKSLGGVLAVLAPSLIELAKDVISKIAGKVKEKIENKIDTVFDKEEPPAVPVVINPTEPSEPIETVIDVPGKGGFKIIITVQHLNE